MPLIVDSFVADPYALLAVLDLPGQDPRRHHSGLDRHVLLGFQRQFEHAFGVGERAGHDFGRDAVIDGDEGGTADGSRPG